MSPTAPVFHAANNGPPAAAAPRCQSLSRGVSTGLIVAFALGLFEIPPIRIMYGPAMRPNPTARAVTRASADRRGQFPRTPKIVATSPSAAATSAPSGRTM